MRMIDADAMRESIRVKVQGEESLALKHELQKWVDDQPTVCGWISVKDKLPNSNGCYIVWRPYFYPDFGMPSICYFDGSNTWHDSYGVDFERTLDAGDVTHWMPLPEPPEVSKNG